MSEDMNRVAEQAVLAMMRGEKRMRRMGLATAVLATLAFCVLLLLFAKHREGDAAPMVALIVLCAAGLFTRHVAIVAVAACASFVLTWLTAVAEWAPPVGGLHCVAIELACALLPTLCFFAVARRNGDPIDVARMATAAALGALSAQAALALVCANAHAPSHLLVFHNGGLLAAIALVATFAWRARMRQVR